MEKRSIRYKGAIYDCGRPVRRATAADLRKFCDAPPAVARAAQTRDLAGSEVPGGL
jgi:hypothetical protein